jgi:predicted XRE-type DNA-binding protein
MSPDTRSKRLNAWQVNLKLRQRGLTQYDIARAAGVDQSRVSKVINRRIVGSAMAERVWRAIEAALNGRAG